MGILTLLGASFSVCIGWAPAPWLRPTIHADEIRAADARGLDVLWVDARSHEDYSKAHIDDAIWLNPKDPDVALLPIAENWLNYPRPIVLYCSSDTCTTSKELAKWLRKQLPDVEIYSLQGGWSAWLQTD
ncbi:MAG: rhodanese-like domain-containing protein [Coraliomargaritaceae bacterium]